MGKYMEYSMLAEDRVIQVSLSDIPAVVLYERDRGNNIPVLYMPVRTDYGETYTEALERAERIADRLTLNRDLACKKSGVAEV
jgi:hypothetical protein